jgi:catechol 2,3-dioxygenase-like lactoylglutathione lyase family enzyme
MRLSFSKRARQVTASRLFHVGILVTDMTKAVSRFSETLGMSFESPRTLGIVLHEQGVISERSITVAYSLDGPPFLELIESQAEGLWGHQHGEGLHHIGVWEDDLVGRIRDEEERGVRSEAKILVAGQLTAVYLDSTKLNGVSVELVAGRREPG